MKPNALVLAILFVCVLGAVHAAAADTSPKRCGDDADDALFAVTSWSGLARYVERFPGCDDGYFAEHMSDIVSTWLAQRPTTLAKLSRASKLHSSLMPLVVRHIDILASQRDIDLIRENADRRCRGGSEVVCAQIIARVDELEREAHRLRRQK